MAPPTHQPQPNSVPSSICTSSIRSRLIHCMRLCHLSFNSTRASKAEAIVSSSDPLHLLFLKNIQRCSWLQMVLPGHALLLVSWMTFHNSACLVIQYKMDTRVNLLILQDFYRLYSPWQYQCIMLYYVSLILQAFMGMRNNFKVERVLYVEKWGERIGCSGSVPPS